MKEKKNITEEEVRAYLSDQGIDEQVLFSLTRLTKDGHTQLQEVFGHFTESQVKEDGSLEMLVERDDGESKYFKLNSSRTVDFKEMNSLKMFVQEANDLINAHNKAIEQADHAYGIINNLSEEKQVAFQTVWCLADNAVEQINQIAKERELEYWDFTPGMIQVIQKQAEMTQELYSQAKRAQELEELKQKKNDQNKER